MSPVKRWYLYDFANSFASSVVIFYFPLLLSSGGASDTWIGISTALATLLLLVFYPALGRSSDQNNHTRMRYILISSLAMLGTLFVMGILTNTAPSTYPILLIGILCALYILFQISFQGSYVFYSSFMQNFENDGHNKDRVSSIGMGLGQLGNAVSIGVMGAFVVGGTLTLFGIQGKSLALILGGTIFIVLSLPFLLQKTTAQTTGATPRTVPAHSMTLLKKIYTDKKLFLYLIGYMFVADSISTLQIYLTLYLKNVFHFTDKMSSLAGVASLGMLFLTCMVLGARAHTIVNKNKALAIAGIIYICMYILFGLTPNVPALAYLCLAFAGVAYGLFFPLARSLYSDIVPKESQAEYFSSFVIFERAATIIGPITWIIVFEILHNFPLELRYRANILVLSIIASFGLYLIQKSFRTKATLAPYTHMV